MSNHLHVIGVPHTIPNDDFSVCAFTTKVRLFPDFIQPFGWHVVEYSNEGSSSHAAHHVVILTAERFNALIRRRARTEPLDDDVNNAPLQAEFQRELLNKLRKHAIPGDIVCHVWGPNMEVKNQLPHCHHIELCVGYTASPGLPFRIYESSAWMHWHYGKAGQEDGSNYHWVVPSPIDIDLWPASDKPGEHVLFLGRVTQRKGIDVLLEVARRMPDLRFVAHGPGDSTKWANEAPSNLMFKGPIFGRERTDIVQRARCMVMPTLFIEPFGNSGVEAQLCGTPLVSSSYGAFLETVEDGVSGYRCHTLADWTEAIRLAASLNRSQIAFRARERYSGESIGRGYDRALRQLKDLSGPGWYSEKSRKFSAPDATRMFQRIWLFVPYYGYFPNYFQLYLDSLSENSNCLSVVLLTDLDLSSYRVPENLIVIEKSFYSFKMEAARFMNREFGIDVNAENVINSFYKLVDFKITYPKMFSDLWEKIGVRDGDFVGWGDCDLIYGKISDFLNIDVDYQVIGGFHGHFTAIRNTDSFINLFLDVQDLDKILLDEKVHIADEIAFRKPLESYIKKNKLKMLYANRYFCDIVPEVFFGLFRKNHTERGKNFFDVYNPEKEIRHVRKDSDGRLTVVYEDRDSRQTMYCHLQKRQMNVEFEQATMRRPYLICEKSFVACRDGS